MKTAISLPDQLFQRAEEYAASQSLNRSELYAHALEEFLERHAHNSITAQLNALYSDEDSSLAPELEALSDEALKAAFATR
jgi:metal-responsive CopG/Arc/MetJ family transcriptional regulator